MKCPACGTRLSKGAPFCPTCYTPLGVSGAPPSASATASTTASPPPAALSAPVTVMAPRPRRAGRRPRGAPLAMAGGLVVALLVVALLLTRPWEGLIAPGGTGTGTVSAIPLLSGDGSGGRWRLGGGSGATSVSSAQTPGCMEGPCPGTMTVRFSDGSQTTVDDVSEIAQISQVDPAHYLAVAGFCYLNCTVRVYAIDTAAHSVATVLDRAQGNGTSNTSYFPMPQGACGLALTYRGATYTVRALPDKASQSSASWLLYPGDKTCPSRGHAAGSSGAAIGPVAASPSPQNTATTQAPPVVAAPQDTPTSTVMPQDIPTSTVVVQETPTSSGPTSVPTRTAHAPVAADILRALGRAMATRNYHTTIVESYDTGKEHYTLRTVATVIHRGAKTLLHMQTQSGGSGTTDIVDTGTHICVHFPGPTQFPCQSPGDTFSALLDLSPDATVTQFHHAATATIVGDSTIAGQRGHHIRLRARYVVQGKDSPVTTTMTGTLYTARETNLPINETIQSTVEGNRVTITRVTITWSHWDDPHLSIPSVPAS